jgi:hypothetical protein
MVNNCKRGQGSSWIVGSAAEGEGGGGGVGGDAYLIRQF